MLRKSSAIAMTRLQVILGLSFIAGSLLVSSAEIPKPSYTRTMLKVSRSLPGETEELKVRTSEGNVATLIVKRRERSGSLDEQAKMKTGNDVAQRNENVSTASPVNAEPASGEEIGRPEVEQLEETREKNSSGNSTFRKPEVLDVLSDRSDETNTSEISRSTSINERIIDYGNWTPLSKDGRALETYNGKDNKESSWKPLRTRPEIIPNDRTNFARYRNPSQEALIFGRNMQDGEANNYQTDGTTIGRNVANGPTQYAFLPHQQRPLTRTNIGANLSKNRGGKHVPPEVTIRSEIKVKSMPKRTAMSIDADGTPVIQGTRVPDEPMDKIQTWRNARVINNKLITESPDAQNIEPTTGFYAADGAAERQRFERFFKDVNRRYGRNFGEERNVYFEWDPKANQNPALNAEVYETRNDNYRSNIQKRMLHPESYQIYPNSQMYTPDSQKISPVVLKPGARAPVLQYAHPELGVQPAKILKNSEKRRPENFPENQNSFTEQKHKKKYVLNDKNLIDSYTQKNYYPNQHFYGLKQPSEQSFWVKISENLRNQFSTGVEKVSQLTRPVFDPLVEATQKISQNLGLSRSKEAQDKIGTIASTGSILIPALGLVASGAALGIGAVAVGRYLDVDVLKRGRMNPNEGVIGEDLDLERSRALEAIEDSLPIIDPAMAKSDAVEPLILPPRDTTPSNLDTTENPDGSNISNLDKRSDLNEDSVFVILEEPEETRSTENRQTKPTVEEIGYVEKRQRQRRSVGEDYIRRIDNRQPDPILEEIDNVEAKKRQRTGAIDDYFIGINENTYENEHLRRTGLDSLVEIIEIDAPIKGKADIPDIVAKMLKKDKNADQEVINHHREEIARRERRDADRDRETNGVFQILEDTKTMETLQVDGDWSNGLCAKKIFCEAMIQRGPEASVLMEKKMDALLGRMQADAASEVSGHFQEVMEAIRRHDCSSFFCQQPKQTILFL